VAGAGINLTVRAGRLHQRLYNAIKRFRNPRRGFEQIGEYMMGSVLKNFEEGGRPDPWAPLKGRTLLARAGGARKAIKKRGGLRKAAAKAIYGHKILIDSGRLRGSIHYLAGQSSVQIGSNLVYAATHQYGRRFTKARGSRSGSSTWSNIPARPFLVMQEEDRSAVRDILHRYLVEPLR